MPAWDLKELDLEAGATKVIPFSFRADSFIVYARGTVPAPGIRIRPGAGIGVSSLELIGDGSVSVPARPGDEKYIVLENGTADTQHLFIIASQGVLPTVVGTTGAGALDMSVEAMASLGSPNTYRQRGKVLYLTGFEIDRNDWAYWSSDAFLGMGGSIDVWEGDGVAAGEQPFRGSKCLRIHADAVAAAGEAWTSAIKLLPAMWAENMGVELELAFGENAQDFRMELGWDSAGKTRRAAILVDPINKNLSYLSSVGPDVWTEFGTFFGEWRSQAAASLRWANCKLVVSDNQDEYMAFYINNEFYPLAGIQVPTGTYPITAFERLAINLRVTDNDLTEGIAYVDDVILTGREEGKL